MTLLHYINNLFLHKRKHSTQKINVEINLWHIREAIPELFPLQLTSIHVHFTKEVAFMCQSS